MVARTIENKLLLCSQHYWCDGIVRSLLNRSESLAVSSGGRCGL